MKIDGMTEKLIELVKPNIFLYDPKHADHRDSAKRYAAWQNISNAMDIPEMDGELLLLAAFRTSNCTLRIVLW